MDQRPARKKKSKNREAKTFCDLFFSRSCLVVHVTWSVSKNERAKKTTIFMNLGEARFAGET